MKGKEAGGGRETVLEAAPGQVPAPEDMIWEVDEDADGCVSWEDCVATCVEMLPFLSHAHRPVLAARAGSHEHGRPANWLPPAREMPPPPPRCAHPALRPFRPLSRRPHCLHPAGETRGGVTHARDGGAATTAWCTTSRGTSHASSSRSWSDLRGGAVLKRRSSPSASRLASPRPAGGGASYCVPTQRGQPCVPPRRHVAARRTQVLDAGRGGAGLDQRRPVSRPGCNTRSTPAAGRAH